MLLKQRAILLMSFLVAWGQLLYANTEGAKVSYDEKIYLSAVYPVPVSSVIISGIKTKVILDTAGSGAPMLTEQFAKKIKIIKQTQYIPAVIFIDKRVRLDFGSLGMGSPEVGVANPRDHWFKKYNIAGLFNPTVVAESLSRKKDIINSVVLDFLDKRFYGVQANSQQALNTYLDKRYAKQVKIVAPLLYSKYYKILVQGGIEGRKEVPILIDTGANSSSFDKPYLEDIPSVKQIRVKNFLGRVFYQGETAIQSVKLNGAVIGKVKLNISEADVRVAPSTSENKAYQGIIGMDIMKHCALAISYPQTATFYCTPQGELTQ